MQNVTCTRFFTAALFVIAKYCPQPKSPSTGDFLDQLWYTKYHVVVKKEGEKNLWIDRVKSPRIVLSKKSSVYILLHFMCNEGRNCTHVYIYDYRYVNMLL